MNNLMSEVISLNYPYCHKNIVEYNGLRIFIRVMHTIYLGQN